MCFAICALSSKISQTLITFILRDYEGLIKLIVLLSYIYIQYEVHRCTITLNL
jgi:uncharacterized protein YqhQ